MPLMLGDMSDITRSTGRPLRRLRSASSGPASRKSPSMNSTPATGSIGRISSANTDPLPFNALAAYWLQPPGAAPRSTTSIPGLRRRSAASSSSSLKAARERNPSFRARFTYASAACSLSQRSLDLLRFAMESPLRPATPRPGALYNAAMELNERQKKHLRRLGHALHPLVQM